MLWFSAGEESKGNKQNLQPPAGFFRGKSAALDQEPLGALVPFWPSCGAERAAVLLGPGVHSTCSPLSSVNSGLRRGHGGPWLFLFPL